MLNHIGYAGPIWSSGRTPAWTGWPARRRRSDFIRGLNALTPPTASFDAAFATKS